MARLDELTPGSRLVGPDRDRRERGRGVLRRKLIEVALPLDAINREAAREKSIRHGHPSTVHLWWARRPLAACRATLLAALLDDPSSDPERFPTDEAQEAERERLLHLVERLVAWETAADPELLAEARRELAAHSPGGLPAIVDPFCGGGSIPLEAQRLGLPVVASDLNPVAVLITRALTEMPHANLDRPSVTAEGRATAAPGPLDGLAQDIRHFGRRVLDEAQRRLAPLYPPVDVSGAGSPEVVAWLWARTARCPNPACRATMPLQSSTVLSTKKGRQAWVEPVVDRGSVSFRVRTDAGTPPAPSKLGRGASFRCVVCGEVAPDEHVKREGHAGRFGLVPTATVLKGARGRLYVDPQPVPEAGARRDDLTWLDQPLPGNTRWFSPPVYGLTSYADLFTPRQLATLDALAELISESFDAALTAARGAGLAEDEAQARALAVLTYLALALDRVVISANTLVRWNSVGEKAQHAFGRQALPMVWDFAEVNVFGSSTGSFAAALELLVDPLTRLHPGAPAAIAQRDATAQVDTNGAASAMVCTDPPYYDNIGYADLSDFFYLWLRRVLRGRQGDLLATLLTPKLPELVADPHRFGSRPAAEKHFQDGLGLAFRRLRDVQDPERPLVMFYAFKQTERIGGSHASTGWETMLEGLMAAGFCITGTWPIRTEMATRQVAMNTSALASSVLLVCRLRPSDAPLTTRKDFLSILQAELPAAMRHLQAGNIAPVDLAQAAIGPGMAVYSRYAGVIEANGKPMTVRTALELINRTLDEMLAEQEGDFDAQTRWAISWFAQYGVDPGPFGVAETLCKARNVAMNGLVESGIAAVSAGQVRLRDHDEAARECEPSRDAAPTVWEVVQQLIRRLDQRGEQAAGALLGSAGALGEAAKELAYRLYVLCERKGWAQQAVAYNGLVVAWPELVRLAAQPTTARHPEMEG
jgi:putative DNA methylase